MQGVEKPAAEEPSEQRFLVWVVRHLGWPCGRGLQPVAITGVFFAQALQFFVQMFVVDLLLLALRSVIFPDPGM